VRKESSRLQRAAIFILSEPDVSRPATFSLPLARLMQFQHNFYVIRNSLAFVSLLITHYLPYSHHVARADDSRLPCVRFDVQSAVRFKAARRALESLSGERDAHAPPSRVS
jgi:hypothetical protein